MVFSRLGDQIAILGGGAKILALAPTPLPPKLGKSSYNCDLAKFTSFLLAFRLI